MTDNEIIKALECCTNEGFQDCENCPLNKPHQPCKKTLLPQITLSLINRQRAEIERLQNSGIRANSVEDWITFCNKLRAEAIKEFAERLKEIIDGNSSGYLFIPEKRLDNLVKEMVGEG